jgi:hypothetical protein
MKTMLAASLLNPVVLFFLLGLFAVWVRSDLDMPQPIPKVLALYLLLSIGFRGGVELHRADIGSEVVTTLVAAILMAVAVPLYAFFWLRRRVDVANAAALAASYGSVSAVTFVTAVAYLVSLGVASGGHMVAALALMESPAIVIGVILARRYDGSGNAAKRDSKPTLLPHLRDAFFNGSVVVILGSLLIGLATGERGERALKPFTTDLFQGVLCLFLLDMGLVAGRRLGAIMSMARWLVAFCVLLPLFNAVLGLGLAYALRMSPGNAFLFCVLCASASYIAVPAAMRLAVPTADPGLYVTAAMALTFPFNILFGLPLYFAAIAWIWG